MRKNIINQEKYSGEHIDVKIKFEGHINYLSENFGEVRTNYLK